MNKKRSPIHVVLVFALILLTLAGCAGSVREPVTSAPETVETTEQYDPWGYYDIDPALKKLNYDLDYTTVYYGLPDSDSGKVRNLTGTQVDDYQISLGAIGWEILASMEDLAAFEENYEDVKAACFEWGLQQGMIVDGDSELIGLVRKTVNVEYDEEFFHDNSLLVIDLCVQGAAEARFYPENLATNGETVSIDVLWDRDNAWLAGCCGQFCLIVIPAGCTTAELNICWSSAK